MAQVAQSEDVIAVARSLGVDIDKAVKFKANTAIKKVAAQLRGDAVTFSGEDAEFGSFLRHIIGRKADRAVSKVAKKVGPALAIASFVVPGVGPLVGGSALAAMAAADKLLGDPKIKNSAQLVNNTKALAAMGDPAARRGAAVLGAVAQIREAKKAAPGTPVIPAVPPPPVASAANARPPTKVVPPVVNAAAYVQHVARDTVKNLAVMATANAHKKGIFVRIKEWLVGT